MASERIQRRIDLLLDEADEAVSKSDWKLVRDRAQNVLALDPNNPDALALAAASERAQDASGATTGELASSDATGRAATTNSEPSSKGTDLPSGLITYLFTDVQGSTPMWQQHPQEMKNVMARHDFLLTSAVEINGGTVVRPRGEGDSIFAVFPRAMNAVVAACAAQHLLLREIWPEDIAINVRMAMHTGESELRDHDYYGNTVNRCARLRSIAHGGQIVISEVTAQLVRDDLSGGISLRELGAHRLKDLQRPEQVFQLMHPDLPADFPALNSLNAHVPAIPISTPFVGRQQELGTLKAALDNTQAGHGSVAMLAGEPGIGKTRTAQELANYAKTSGTEVLWGRSYEEAGSPPFWPWVEVTRSLVRDRDKMQLQSEMGPGAAVVAEFVPEVSVTLPDLQPPPALEPEQASFRLFDALTTFLTNVSRAKPIMLVLEDLHWADSPSLRMLEFLSGRIADAAILVLGVYRDAEVTPEHPLTETLANLSREPRFRLEILHRFSAEETNHLIEATAGQSPTEELAQRIQEHTDGNPLFVNEVVRLLGERGGPGYIDGKTAKVLAVPEGIRAVIRQRLRRLSTLCNQVLTTASVVGREFEYGLLYQLAEETTEDDFSAALEEAVQSHVVEELETQPGRYHFSHSLIQQALAEELSTTRRVRLHARTAEALEEMYGPDAEAHAAELAHHFAEAATVTGTEKLVRYSTIAGERALATNAHDEALAHFQRGLAAKEIFLTATEPASDSESAALLFGFGRAQGSAGQLTDAWETLGCAFDYYAKAGDVGMAVAVAEYPLLFVAGLPPAVHMVEQALSLVGPDSHEAGRLLSRYGLLVNLEAGDYERATEAFDRALAIAEREGDVALEMRTLANAADTDWYQLRGQEVLRKSLRAIELARRASDPRAEAWPRFLASFESTSEGDLAGAGEHAQEMLTQTERLQDHGLLALACLANANVFRIKGDWISAREYIDRGLNLEPRQTWILSNLALVEYETGNFLQGNTYVEQVLEIMRATPPGGTAEYHFPAWLIPVVSRIAGVVNGLDIAQEAAQAALSSPACKPMVATLRVGNALIAVIQNEIAGAKQRYDDLLQSRDDMAGINIAVGMPSIHRVLGLLAHTMNDLDQAAAHFEEAIAFCRNAGYRPELAWTCCDYADALRERDGEGDRAKAISLLDESLAISSELGMRPLMERVLSRREILGA